jgi:hypothetical protein
MKTVLFIAVDLLFNVGIVTVKCSIIKIHIIKEVSGV